MSDAQLSAGAVARFVAGAVAGVCLAAAALVATALAPVTFPPREEAQAVPAAPRSDATVRLSFVTTARASIPCALLAQGAGLQRCDVAYRAAVVQHGDNVLLFGTGASPDVMPGFPVLRMLPAPVPTGALDTFLAAQPVHQVLLPTPRWQHLGGLGAVPLADVPVYVGRTDAWHVSTGPWPYRLGMDPALLDDARPRLLRLDWARSRRFGARASFDVFGDQTVWALSIRGTTSDEVALVVTLGSGRRVLIVADAVWTADQVQALRPRPAWSTWLLDRNRMQLYHTLRLLHALGRAGIEVTPLLDGALDLPEWPQWAE